MTLALACTKEGVFALNNACPHEGGPLGEGSLDGNTITCPLHSYKFDCGKGVCLTESRYKAQTFETKIEDGKIFVRMAAASAATVAAAQPADPAKAKSPVEQWKIAKHGMDVWPDVLRYAQQKTPMNSIEVPELERMKWYGFFYRKNNDNNHYMIRIRIPGCEMTRDQARAIAFIAYESGYCLVDVTTRGNVQIQGLTIDKLPSVRNALEAVGLTSRQTGHDNVRNITSHPYSGIDPEELIDTRALAKQMQDMIVGSREFSDLPRKCNVALNGRPDTATHAWTQDINFVAMKHPQDRAVGFALLLGGHQGGHGAALAIPMPVFVRPDQVLDVTAATLRTFRELGYRHNRNQVRMRYMIDRLGADATLAEIEKRLGYALQRSHHAPPPPAGDENFMGWFKQKQEDLWALGVCVPVGRLTWDQFEGLAVIAQQYGAGVLRTTLDQNLVIPGIPTAQKAAVGYAIARYGLTFEPDSVTRNVVSCTGKQFCNLAVIETKGYAYGLIEELRRRNVQLHGINLRMSGCPSSCGMSHTADIGLKGGKIRRGMRVLDAFDVFLGGGVADTVRMGIPYKKMVPISELPDLIQHIVKDFYLHRAEGETFSGYWRKKLSGQKEVAQAAAVPVWSCSQCGHRHVAADPPAFCPVCAALRAKFEPAEDASSPAAAPVPETIAVSQEKSLPVLQASIKRIVIVGGGIAGHTAAATCRSLDAAAKITLLTDEVHSFYNRLNLTRFLAQEIQHKDLFDYTPAWYAEQRVEVWTNTRVLGLDPIKKEIITQQGQPLAYDACILAHGSAANTPPFYREGLPGLMLLRTLQDVEGMATSAQKGLKVAIIGGGVLGLEAAYGFVKRGCEVNVFEYFPYLMPRQLDKAAAAMFLDMVQEKGIRVHTGQGVQKILGEQKAQGLVLADGRSFDADLIVVSTGIKPNIDWVQRSGLHCKRGVLVDDRMQTSAPDVYAAGDVAEWQGNVVGLWTNAIEQAKVAAANAMGKMAYFEGFLPVTVLKCLEISLVSMGQIIEDGGAIGSKWRCDAGKRFYQRLVLRQGIPVGGILLGTLSGMGDMQKVIEKGLELEKLRHQVVPEEELMNA